MTPPPKPKIPPRRVLYATIGVLLAALLLGAGGLMWLGGSNAGSSGIGIGGPFTLQDSSGKPVTDRDFRGRYMLVYFGYTFCPDVCPTTLSSVADALDKLGPDAAKVRPVFITGSPSPAVRTAPSVAARRAPRRSVPSVSRPAGRKEKARCVVPAEGGQYPPVRAGY